jgi:hypothetical protein
MRPLWLALTFVTTLGAPAVAQVHVATVLPRDREIELAIAAAPSDVGSRASVYVFTSQGYEKARDGENGFTCLVNRDSELEGYHVLKPTCWDAHGSRTIVPAIIEIAKRRAAGQSVADVTAGIRQSIEDGTLHLFDKVGVAYMLQGDVSNYDAATGRILSRRFPPHVMIYAPGVTPSDVGIAGRAAFNDVRAPLIYESATGYRYLVVRVPNASAPQQSLPH